LTGELIAAEEALRIGLVNAVFSAERFREEVEARVVQLLTRAPQARKRAKHLLAQHAADGINLSAQYEAEARAFAECYRTSEPLEGQSAFLEKRAATWTS
jgi:enoyl-CoA hydratase/carnithine racemase